MSARVQIPAPFRAYTDKKKSVELEAATVGALLDALVVEHPALKLHLFDAAGRLRRFVNVYVNDDDIRHLQGHKTPLAPGDVVSLVPSVSGG